MNFPPTLPVRVARVDTLTPRIKRFTLLPAEDDSLPGFAAGSHIMVHLNIAERSYRNAYSLIGAPSERSAYQIAVRRQEHSRGGSVYLHEQVRAGDRLKVTPPANLFSLDRLAAKHVLIAGGIGITPFMSYVHELTAETVPFELHYAYRDSGHAAFRDALATRLDKRLHEYDAAHGRRLQPRRLLAAQPLGTHVYVCGPGGLIQAVVECARALGWPESHVHYERFVAPQPGRPFAVTCARAGREIEVPADLTLLEALEAAGIEVPSLCRAGVCGQCETELLQGEAEHRDTYLSDASRCGKIMPCVSRAKCERLVLNL